MKENGAWLFENNHFGENGLTMAVLPQPTVGGISITL
jgi:hypothetical protein